MARTLAAHMVAAHMLGRLPGPPRTPASSHACILASLSAPSEQTQERPSAHQAHSEKTKMVVVDARYWVRYVSGASTSASTAAASVAARPFAQLKKSGSGVLKIRACAREMSLSVPLTFLTFGFSPTIYRVDERRKENPCRVARSVESPVQTLRRLSQSRQSKSRE